MLPQFHSEYFLSGQKMYELRQGVQVLFFIFRCLLNFTMKCIGGQIKTFSFLFCTTCDAKSTKVERVNIQQFWNNDKKDNRLIQCVYMQWKSTNRWRLLIHRMIMKKQVKIEQIKRKQTCSVSFVKTLKFLENKFKIVQNSFLEITIKISWKTHQSQWSLHDKYGRSKAEDS